MLNSPAENAPCHESGVETTKVPSKSLAEVRIIELATREDGKYRPAIQEYLEAESLMRMYRETLEVNVDKIREAALKAMGVYSTLFSEGLHALNNNADALISLRKIIAEMGPRVPGPWRTAHEHAQWERTRGAGAEAGYLVS